LRFGKRSVAALAVKQSANNSPFNHHNFARKTHLLNVCDLFSILTLFLIGLPNMPQPAALLLRCLLVCFPLCASGCFGGSGAVDPVAQVDEDDGLADARSGLLEMADMFKHFNDQSITPPKTAAEFARHDVLFPVAGVLLPAGKIVYAGGTLDQSDPPKLLGYAKDAETAGGWILLSDGTVNEVTAAEFAAVPKP